MRHPLTGRLRSQFGRYFDRPFDQLLRSRSGNPDQMAYVDLVRRRFPPHRIDSVEAYGW
jgi:hypothetical protein